MKKSYLFFLLLASVFSFISCANNSKENNNNDNSSTPSLNPVTSGGDASFSCKLDGKEVSGKGTDQNINAAFHLTGDDKGQIFFRLSDMNNIGDKLQFQVPAKVGSTTFAVSPNYSYGGYVTAGFANYIDDPIIVTITSISSSRVAGTFSGKYTLQKGSGDANTKQTIEVADGKFDIPFSSSADWKKMYHAE